MTLRQRWLGRDQIQEGALGARPGEFLVAQGKEAPFGQIELHLHEASCLQCVADHQAGHDGDASAGLDGGADGFIGGQFERYREVSWC